MAARKTRTDIEKRAEELIGELRSLYARDYFSSEDPFKHTVGGLIRLAREKKGISRAHLAKVTGISQNSLANYEKAGQQDGQFPPIPKMALVCMELGIDPRQVFKVSLPFDFEWSEQSDDYKNVQMDFDRFLTTLDSDEREIKSLNDHIRWANESIRELQRMDHSNRAQIVSLERKNKKIKGEVIRLKMKIKNGPDLDDPSRSKKPKNNTEAVSAASTRPKKGQSDEVI